MKKSLKRLLALLTALTMLFACVPAVFAEDEEEDGLFDEGGWEDYMDVFVVFLEREVPLTVNESTTIGALVQNQGDGARYDWRSSDPGVISVSGAGSEATVTARSAGSADITLTVTRSDGSCDFDSVTVTARNAATPVSVSGGGDIRVEAGESSRLSASPSGGSGSYTYEWDAYGDAALSFIDKMRGNAEVYAGKAGSGTVMLTVYDAEDPTNNDSVSWSFTVTEKPQVTPPEIQLSRGTVDLGVGAAASLAVSATGGSGSYEYVWRTDNASVVSVSGNRENATIKAADTLLPSAHTAVISVYVRDVESGLTSNTETCTVNVSGGNAAYNASASAAVGAYLSLNTVAASIGQAYRQNFGTALDYSANVILSNTGNAYGSLRLQDDSAVRANTNYSYATFQDMLFRPSSGGEFTTGYRIVEGGNTISGTITISVSGGVGITSISLNANNMRMDLNSSANLLLSVAPSDSNYNVVWTSSNSRIVSVSGSGNRVTLISGGTLGQATITASVTDVNGSRFSSSCLVSVLQDTAYNQFDTSLTLTLGSDYYGSTLANAMSSKFRTVFGYYPADGDSIYFPTLGNTRYGTMYTAAGTAVQTNRNYTFRDWINMYFIPSAAGTYALSYQLSHGRDILYGNINVVVQVPSLTVTLNPTTLQMAPYSTQYLSLSITPASASYHVIWSTSNNNIVKVSGNNTTATINSVGNGTATVYASVTDSRGIEIRRSCTVVVSSSGNVFNPSVSTTLGIPYTGTGTSSAMRSQFTAVYGITLPDSAIIRFSSTGNNEVGVMRLADGNMIRPNVDYTLAQYVAMYTQPVAAGTFSVPYTLSYAGKSLTGTVSVVVSSASISTNITLPNRDAYLFSAASVGTTTGATIFSDSIRNTVGSSWGYLRFGSSSSNLGTLYSDRNCTRITNASNITPALLSSLYFVPNNQNGTFSVPYTVYTNNGAEIARGSLNITIPATSFSDIPAGAYYANAVNWAVGKAITSGTGGNNFSPNMIVNRGQAVTFLWRAAGQPKVTTYNPFTDVSAGAYYYDAVMWAVQQGITAGTSETTFSPDAPLHRNQMLTFLCRANGGYVNPASWSAEAVTWARSRGLLDGIPGTFVADTDCPRCDVVYYLWKNYTA